MRKPRLYIGLCGKAQHGKSSLAHSLQDFFTGKGRSSSITAFASLPKAMLALMGLDHSQLYGVRKIEACYELGGKTPRFAMQSLATEWGRNMLYDEVWVDAWRRAAERNPAEIIIVEDVRHLPEIEELKSLGAIIVEVYRPSKMPQTRWGWWKYHLRQRFEHSSETLDFQACGIQRIVVEEGRPELTLQKLLEKFPQLQ